MQHEAEGPASESSTTTDAAQQTKEPPEPATASSSAANNFAPDDGLVVSRNGKVIFRTPSQGTEDFTAGTVQPFSPKNALTAPRLRIPPEIAQEYLATRIEPQYPEPARKNRVQGPVVLDAWVGKDGRVQRLVAISGNPQLLTAATQAVAQWRFRPFFHAGQPEEFATRVTVVFQLP